MVASIVPANTAITAFVGAARFGPLNDPVRVQSFGEFEQNFGGLLPGDTLGHAVSQFFDNGGKDALIVRAGAGGIGDNDISAPALAGKQQGLWALDKGDMFNLLCIPPFAPAGEIGRQTREAAAKYCETHRALFIADPPAAWTSAAEAEAGIDSFMTRTAYAAVYFPKLRVLDPLQKGAVAEFAPCGAVAGIMARTDAAQGVWRPPAGSTAVLKGVDGLAVALTDAEMQTLNPLGINCLRDLPGYGRTVWGARTLSDDPDDRYVQVRRLASFIEESISYGIKWAAFEPNGEPLWAELRASVGGFLNNLYSDRALVGTTADDAYFVRCDATTTTQSDIDRGVVNIEVGFAPIRSAEFVILTIGQMVGQAAG
ncbi:MAG TPA: phage tail sheath C-terminal domain-containing protein [Pseudolabrys sp.]|nr:phage tail sheath C-terminal domain-containing protein [Pseudolabrys sp.]